MDALLRIRTKDGSEVSKSKFDDVVSKKKKQPKPPKGVSGINKNGEFAKFTPIKTPNTPTTPAPWDDEDTDELTSAINLEDDGKFETENDIFIKQDQEWHELMKEADTIHDDSSSEVPDDDSFSEEIFDGDRSDTDGSDVSIIDSEPEDEIFYNSKATPKAAKVYSGIPIDFDDD